MITTGCPDLWQGGVSRFVANKQGGVPRFVVERGAQICGREGCPDLWQISREGVQICGRDGCLDG